MATVSLNAALRTQTGKGNARKIRAGGQLPAVVYRNGGPATSINIDGRELELAFHRTGDRNTLVNIVVEGGREHLCLIRDVQRHPVSKVLRHVDFYEVTADRPVKVRVVVRSVGRAAGTRAGGTLRIVRRELDLVCNPGDIPEAVDVDVTALRIGQFIRASEITPPAGCTINYGADFNVITVLGKRGLAGEEAALEEAGA